MVVFGRGANALSMVAILSGKPYMDPFGLFTGNQYRMTQRMSTNAQIGYEQYLRQGNERALADFRKNVPNRQIRYPELSYSGQIARSNTAIMRNSMDYAGADANYWSNLPYRGAGLYRTASPLSRFM